MLNLNIFLGAMDCDHENEMWKEFPFFCGPLFLWWEIQWKNGSNTEKNSFFFYYHNYDEERGGGRGQIMIYTSFPVSACTHIRTLSLCSVGV